MANTAAARLRKTSKTLAPVDRKTKYGGTKYCVEHCDIVESLGKQGKSIAEMALVLNVSRDTLYEWEGSFTEFRQALARARTFSQAWWEAKAQSSLGKKQFQAQLWRYSMAGRFKADYADTGNTVNVAIGAGLLDAISEATASRSARIAQAASPVDATVIEVDKAK